MPELPEVETYRRYLEATSLYQTITHVDVEDHKLLTVSYDTLQHALKGNQFTGTRRVGKNLFVLTRTGAVVTMHFGMTGDLAYYRDEEDRPSYARIVFHFNTGFKLAFICPRKFERIGLIEDIDGYLRHKKIAPDALEASTEDLTRVFMKKKASVKPVLLDQSTVAGLGNWIVDEVLFDAAIHPERVANQLGEDEINRLHAAIRKVLTIAIEREAVYRDFPKDFLIHVREWDDSPHSESGGHRLCPRCTTRIEKAYVGGRATYFCPQCQRE